MQTGEGNLASRLLDALPQTQCTRCGYPDCAAYAQAMAQGEADINQCPPGGAEGVGRLAAILELPAKALNPEFGLEGPRSIAFVDEAWCIGCTLCIDACPTDAIFGTNKRMHAVIEAYCTGCELCLPACPVDCIGLETVQVGSNDPTQDPPTGWNAWSPSLADTARHRYNAATIRRTEMKAAHRSAKAAQAQAKLADMAAYSRITDPAVLDHKKAVILAAMERARQRQAT
ncbi:MAG: RnfABCDGE type electron transport complex subunit B [Betaproteobacteria bacterium]